MFFTPTLRAALRLGRTSLTISEHGPGALPQILPYLWLRDACQCPQCIHPQTNSKLFATGTLPLDTAPSHNPNAAKVTKDTLDIQWKDSHTSSYSIPWLLRHGTPSGLSSAHADVAYLSWKGLDVQQSGDGTAFESPFFTSYEQLDTPSGLLKAYNQLLSAGLLFVRGVPTEETSDERCTVRELVGKFGVLRETIYGHVWDVVNRPGTDNIAYTNLNLGLHADMQYLEHPPRFQVLHCLRNRVKGGKSLFVDALHAAYSLSVEDIEVLASTPVAFHYENEKHHLYGAHPTLELAEASPYTSMTTTNVIEEEEGSSSGSALSVLNALNGRIITHVNYSPPFQAPLPPNTPPSFFGAFARFEALLRQPAARFEYRLQEGDAVLFDNRRMFHARGPYDAQQEGAAVHDRWLKGGYFEADEVMDKRRMLMRKLGMLPA